MKLEPMRAASFLHLG